MARAPPPPGISRTFYKRELPSPPAVAFSSEQGQGIFKAALAAGNMQGFFSLIEQYRTQDEPAYCGLASVSMVLNALAIDPRRVWKGSWRFFHEQMLDCCLPLEKVRAEGITLDQAACLARCNGADVVTFPFGAVSEDEFRGMVRQATASADHHLVVSYSRKAFLQTGDGHFSPIGGYSPDLDMVLILDTARFKYPSHWVKLEDLYNAMAAVDSVTGRPRGFMRMGLRETLDSVLFTLDVRDASWMEAWRFAERGCVRAAAAAAAVVKEIDKIKKTLISSSPSTDDDLSIANRAAAATAAESVIGAAALAAPSAAVKKFLAVRTVGSCSGGTCIQTAAIETFLNELRSMPLFAVINNALQTVVAPTNENENEKNAINECGGTLNSEELLQILEEIEEECGGITTTTTTTTTTTSLPAVPGSLLAERLTTLLLLTPNEAWHQQQLPFADALRAEILSLLDVSSHAVVACELKYLAEQMQEMTVVEKVMQEGAAAAVARGCGRIDCAEAGRHVCADDGGGGEEVLRRVQQVNA